MLALLVHDSGKVLEGKTLKYWNFGPAMQYIQQLWYFGGILGKCLTVRTSQDIFMLVLVIQFQIKSLKRILSCTVVVITIVS